MAEKVFEDLVAAQAEGADVDKWLLERFKSPSAACSIDEFAAFYLGLVKTQTDEFIKNNTSTNNTPRKMTLTEPPDSILKRDERRSSVEHNKSQDNQIAKRQPSRELFSSQNRNSPHTLDSQNAESPFPLDRKNFMQLDSSTPNRTLNQSRSSIDVTPTNTSTPTSFKTSSRNSSYDQSSSTCRNTSKNSLDFSSKNNSVNRRMNLSSPLCLADFINTSNVSGSGKSGKKKGASQVSPSVDQTTPKLSNLDFPTLGSTPQSDTKTQQKKGDKPKRRVAPTLVSRNSTPGSSNFFSSSFQSDNNLLSVNAFETEEIDMLSERRSMRNERDAISKNLPQEIEQRVHLHTILRENLPAALQSPRKAPAFKFDETKIEEKVLLTIMGKIYSFLLDLNMVPNILTEYSYLFNLLNSECEPLEQLSSQNLGKSTIDIASNVLKNLNNCVFFTLVVLNCQRKCLLLLDIMTLRVLVENERIQELATELCEHLRIAVQQKSQLDSSTKHSKVAGNSMSNVVLFQQENDNRDNFPSDREFGAFKKQRDAFYSILRSWELKHLDQTYDFQKDLGSKIRSLITLMEHPINMAHLAKLFTAQLIISCNFDNSANELQMVLPNIDLGKLSKLRQRLVAPSQFSTQFQFPGNQAFFRDFIICCDQHTIFMEQLKISLVSELMQINDSSMDTLCITQSNDDEKSFREEFIVRAETMTTMRVLAKFIGFAATRPYCYDGYRNPLVDQKQLHIRNMVRTTQSLFVGMQRFLLLVSLQLHPDFDVKPVVLRSIEGHKLLVTIPWLVEYLAMLDFITIRLDYYRDLFKLLYTVYMRVNVAIERGSLCVMPTSKFIIRSCLGWLFEHPDIPEEYCSLKGTALREFDEPSADQSQSFEHLSPHLETILNAACPFLADFRVSMMPRQRMTKVVSRTGRYRHITTKFQDKANIQKTKVQDSRERLIEAFLASQTLSVRRIVEFAIDRVTSAVVKDFQVKHLLAIRKQAKLETEKAAQSIPELEVLTKKMIGIFQQHLVHLQDQWTHDLKSNSTARIEGVFESLLPIETLLDVKKTLINITLERTVEKLNEWSSTSIHTIEIFSRDIQLDAAKLLDTQQQSGNKRTTSNIVIDLTASTMPSDYFKELQTLLHKASRHPKDIKADDIVNCIEMASSVVQKQILPSNAFRNIAFYMLQLLFLCIAHRLDLITKDVLSKVFEMWRHEKLSPYTSKDPQSLENNTQNRRKVDDFVFSAVISSRLLVTMQGKPRETFEAYGNFVAQLVQQGFITGEMLNEQSVKLYKHDWSPETLNDIAFLINHIKSQLSSKATSEEQLFMDLVVDLARDMENF